MFLLRLTDTRLNSILQNDYPHKFLEVFIVDGLSSDGTQQIIQEFISEYHFIKLLLNDKGVILFSIPNLFNDSLYLRTFLSTI